jgi:tetratricopeptide (TPR) repeat protein
VALSRKLAAKSDSFIHLLATTLSNIADFHNARNHPATEEAFSEAIAQFRRLARTSPNAYQPDLAAVLSNHASRLASRRLLNQAEEEASEALSIRRELAGLNPEAYEPRLAKALLLIASVHDSQGRHEAEMEYEEALALYRKLDSLYPNQFEPLLKLAQRSLDSIRNRRVWRKR